MPRRHKHKSLLIGLLPLCAKGTTALNFDAGTFHTCTVQMDGKVMCWGYNTEGQLGDGTTTTRTNPVDDYNFLVMGAMGLDIRGDWNEKSGVFHSVVVN